jgi:hypothetical protein
MKLLPLDTKPERCGCDVRMYKELQAAISANIFKNLFDLYAYHKKVLPANWIEHDIIMDVKEWFNDDLVVPMFICTGGDNYVLEKHKVSRFKLNFMEVVYVEFDGIEGEFTVDEIPMKYAAELSNNIFNKVVKL